MSDETILFKSVSFLTTLVKCPRGNYYLNNGFNEEDFVTEVVKVLKKDLPLSESEKEAYIKKVERDYLISLSFLDKEGLIYLKDGRYYITKEGNSISDFMMNLSKVYSTFSLNETDIPYRLYPNSNIYYGLN